MMQTLLILFTFIASNGINHASFVQLNAQVGAQAKAGANAGAGVMAQMFGGLFGPAKLTPPADGIDVTVTMDAYLAQRATIPYRHVASVILEKWGAQDRMTNNRKPILSTRGLLGHCHENPLSGQTAIPSPDF